MSEWLYNSKYKSRGFGIMWALAIRRLNGYWNRTKVFRDEIRYHICQIKKEQQKYLAVGWKNVHFLNWCVIQTHRNTCFCWTRYSAQIFTDNTALQFWIAAFVIKLFKVITDPFATNGLKTNLVTSIIKPSDVNWLRTLMNNYSNTMAKCWQGVKKRFRYSSVYVMSLTVTKSPWPSWT